MALCSNCAESIYLKKRIEVEGIVAHCGVCKRQQPKAFPLLHLASLIGTAIERNFRTIDAQSISIDEYEYSPAPTEFELKEVVIGILQQNVDFLDELVEEIANREDYQPRIGARCFLDPGALYTPVPKREMFDYFTPRWNSIINELKYNRRFFSESVREFFDGIFKDVDKISTFETSPLKIMPVVREELPGFPVYRCRLIDVDQIETIQNDPFKHVGPTPKEKARAGRMSPEGVVALYCATEPDTAIAETRPTIGHISAVIELRFTRALRLLDLKRLERAIDDGWDAFLDPKYIITVETKRFLRKLHNLISQPVIPGKEADYLITQTMAEYLAHVHQPGFDGIVFGSAQHAKGTNIVLFSNRNGANNNEPFSVNYVPGSLTFYRTKQVTYTHIEMIRENQLSLY